MSDRQFFKTSGISAFICSHQNHFEDDTSVLVQEDIVAKSLSFEVKHMEIFYFELNFR